MKKLNIIVVAIFLIISIMVTPLYVFAENDTDTDSGFVSFEKWYSVEMSRIDHSNYVIELMSKCGVHPLTDEEKGKMENYTLYDWASYFEYVNRVYKSLSDLEDNIVLDDVEKAVVLYRFFFRSDEYPLVYKYYRKCDMYSDENRSDKEDIYNMFFDYYMAYSEVQKNINIIKGFDGSGWIK